MSGSDSPTFFHGQPWSNWIERIGRDKPLSDDESDTQPSTSVNRLSSEDIDLYGFCPERDTFYGVVCEICNAIVKPQALIQHMESRHPSGTPNFPPPSQPIIKPQVKTPYCKLSKLKKTPPMTQAQAAATAAAKLNHTSIKRPLESPTNNLTTTIPVSSPHSPLETITSSATNNNSGNNGNSCNSISSCPVKSPNGNGQSSRRKRFKADRSLLKDREYDPDRHCGVWNEETCKPCTRSLTCKAHTVSLRRTVAGRSKSFDKLLAEHRAAKELPTRPTKLALQGTVTVSGLAPNTPTSLIDSEIPSSPPVLSLPDTYPLPKAVDLLYRCLTPHGTAIPTKLEEDFAKEELRSLESSLTSSTGSQSSSIMGPISVILPSLSPLPGTNEESSVSALLPTTSSSLSLANSSLTSASCSQSSMSTNVLETDPSIEIDSEGISLYSPLPMYKDKSQIQLQKSNHLQSPISRSYQSSMPNLNMFEEQLEQQHVGQINGKRLNHVANNVTRPNKKSKHEYQEYPTAIQVEATTTSTPYPHFSDISWSNCHPEPLAVSRWLRINSSRKQYNFNIH